MESARLSIKEGTCHATYTSISIIFSTKRGVKKKRYWPIIGPFHKAFESDGGRKRG